ncbi:hypothetical protein D3X11_04295 [Streptococcus sp. X16XC17]|uniref:hypothetical protein n=1 Tax=unclassified Streptococcus TaxID=2608887 RepID=UPI00066FE607|nr:MULTISPECIES: hypothetical protein [unclassified Streptococcus]TCD46608.1 hypothetical protein D3X11_04295 [Streptococcus sp. X16XC17]
MKKRQTKSLAFAAILVAFGILIPMVMPLKIIIGPASFTLSSHVPLFIALFLSLPVAVLVALGTALGFFMAGFPMIIVLRALSHLVFAIVGAYAFQKYPKLLEKPSLTFLSAFLLNLLHGLSEFAVVYGLTISENPNPNYVWSLLLLVGFGSLVHGIIDFYFAYYLWKILKNRIGIDFSFKK